MDRQKRETEKAVLSERNLPQSGPNDTVWLPSIFRVIILSMTPKVPCICICAYAGYAWCHENIFNTTTAHINKDVSTVRVHYCKAGTRH
jgi:hypothetical protein